jgi:small subunit ribosomal protein S16
MQRMGRRNRAFFRINAIDERVKRDGKVLEELGWYDPIAKDVAKQLKLDDERVKFWLGRGAKPSDTMMDILAKRNLVDADKWKAARAKRVKAKLENKAAATKYAEATASAAAAKAAEKKPDAPAAG